MRVQLASKTMTVRITTTQQVRQLAEEIKLTKMRKQTYALGPLMLLAIDNEVHRIDGYSRFEDWYIQEFEELSCPRALWDILKIERVRVALGLPQSSIEAIDISKAKKIAQLCGRDGHPQQGYSSKEIIELFRIAAAATLKEVERKVDDLMGKLPSCPSWGNAIGRAKAIYGELSEDQLKEKIAEGFCRWADSQGSSVGRR
jgi:hypothetical protein